MKKMTGLLAISLLVLSGSAFADHGGMHVSAFLDGQYQWTDTGSTTGNGFVLNDGAVYLSKEMGNGMAFVDLAFASTGGATTTFAFAGAKSQAYVNYKYDSGFSWRLGQFDSPFIGVQKNDTKDVWFTRQSELFRNASGTSGYKPATHAGLWLGYDFTSDLNLGILLGNTVGNGSNTAANEIDYGAKLGWASGDIWAHVGYFVNQNGNTVASPKDTMITIGLGGEFGKLTADVEVDLTNGDGATQQSGTALFARVKYGLSDRFDIGARFGSWDKVVAGTAKGNDITFGPQYMMTKDLTLKFDYTLQSTNTGVTGAADVQNHMANVAAVYTL